METRVASSVLNQDERGRVVRPEWTHWIEQGLVYQTGTQDDSITQADDLTLLVRTAVGQRAYLRVHAGASGPMRLRLFEGPTVSSDGFELTPRNRNRTEADNAATEVYLGPTLSADGTRLYSQLVIGSGTAVFPGDFPGAAMWILAENSEYLVRMLEPNVGTPAVNLAIDIYEPDD